MNLIKTLCFFILLVLTTNLRAQTFVYSYTDPCTGLTKSINVPSNGITVTYFNQIQTFNPNDFQNGVFDTWATGVLNSYGNQNPCGSILGVSNAVDVAQGTAMNFISIINNISALSDLQQSLAGPGGSLNTTSAIESAKSSSNKKDKKDKNNNSSQNNSESVNQSNGQSTNGSNSVGTNSQNNTNGQSTESSNQSGSQTNGQSGTTSQNGGQTNGQSGESNGSSQNNQNGGSQTNGQSGESNGTTSQNNQSSQTNQSGGNGSTSTSQNGGQTNGQSGESNSVSSQSSQNSNSQTNSENGSQSTETQNNQSINPSQPNGQLGTQTSQNGSNGAGQNGSSNGQTNEIPDNQSNGTETTEEKRTNVLGGTVNSTQKSTERSGEAGKPSIILSSDFAGFNFKNKEVTFGGKGTAGWTALTWDGKRSYGVLLDYTSIIRGPNLTAFWANMAKRRIDLISLTGTVSFYGRGSQYASLAIGQMWSFPKVKNLKAIYMANGSFGNVYGERFLGTAFITGGMYDWKVSKRIDVKMMNLFIYAPFVSYYNDIVLKSPYVIMPIIGTNIGITKKFKFNVNFGGAYAIKEDIMNFTLMFGTRFAL